MNKLRPLSPKPSPQPSQEPSSTELGSAAMPPVRPLRLLSLPNPTRPSKEPPLGVLVKLPSRILCFDIENKPGTYGGGDFTFPKVTAIGARFLDEKKVYSWCLNRGDVKLMRAAAEEFRVLWDEAGAVVGHNIRRHDVGLLIGLYTSLDLPLLAPRRMVDTYLDQPKMRGLSRSLGNLCARWGCPLQKVEMSEYDWERAYDGVPELVEKMRRRAETDVQINIWLYHELRRRELLP